MADKDTLTTRNGALWVQPDGPNTEVFYLGCHDLGDISEPAGSIEILRCMDKKQGWKTVGYTKSPPEKVTTSIDNMSFLTRDYLERIRWNFVLYILQHSGGEPDIFANHDRAIILNNARIVSRSDKSLVNHETETASGQSRNIEAWPPAIRTGQLVARRQITAETNALNGVVGYSADNEKTRVKIGDKVIACADGSLYSSNVLYSINAGKTWTGTSADPFASGKSIMSIVAFPISSTVTRFIVAQEAEAGVQGKTAYSDDNGTTWNVVNIGGVTAGHGAVGANSLFALDQTHIWLASTNGFIYFSQNGGITWDLQSSGDLTVKDVLCISFFDSDNGMCGCADDVIMKTTDGGNTWEITTSVTGTGDDITVVTPTSDFWWVGTETGHMFYSRDLGDNWEERSFSNSGTGTINDLVFSNDLIGFGIQTISGESTLITTINGGYTWESITTPTNAGLNSLSVADDTTVYAVGEPESGTAVIVKVTWG